MVRPGAIAFLALALIAAASPEEKPMPSSDETPRSLPRPRDGNIAIAEELEAARRVRTLAAYDLFLARHPDHPLAEAARRERARLAERRPR